MRDPPFPGSAAGCWPSGRGGRTASAESWSRLEELGGTRSLRSIRPSIESVLDWAPDWQVIIKLGHWLMEKIRFFLSTYSQTALLYLLWTQQMALLGIFLPPYAAAQRDVHHGVRTHFNLGELHQTRTFRTLYRLSYGAAVWENKLYYYNIQKCY